MADSGTKVVATNRKAHHDYDVLETVEAGIALRGSEVKSVRAAKVQLKDSYAHVRDGEIYLKGAHISQWSHSHGLDGHEPERERKLLLHRHEIDDLRVRLEREHLTLVPLSVYFREGRAKVELGLGKGRLKADKRQAIAERDSQREVDRALGRQRKGMD
jgi:SsrA-binding protein